MTLRVGIYIYSDVEVLDFAAPYEVFSTASRVFARSDPASPLPFIPCLVAESTSAVQARAGFPVQPHFAIDEHPHLDVLVIPGGVAGDAATVHAVVNAVPALVELRGLVSVLDLPAGR